MFVLLLLVLGCFVIAGGYWQIRLFVFDLERGTKNWHSWSSKNMGNPIGRFVNKIDDFAFVLLVTPIVVFTLLSVLGYLMYGALAMFDDKNEIGFLSYWGMFFRLIIFGVVVFFKTLFGRFFAVSLICFEIYSLFLYGTLSPIPILQSLAQWTFDSPGLYVFALVYSCFSILWGALSSFSGDLLEGLQ